MTIDYNSIFLKARRDLRNSGPCYGKHLSKDSMGNCQPLTIHSVLNVEKQSGEPLLDFVTGIARDELERADHLKLNELRNIL